MSRILWEKVRARVRQCGRFLECRERRRREVSFLREKNSSAARC
jgi:hypothetical protein